MDNLFDLQNHKLVSELKQLNFLIERRKVMKTAIRIILVVMIGCALTMNMGCASKVKTSGFLQDYPEFEKGPSGGADQVYFKEGVDFKKYDKIMMDQVVFYFSKDSKYKGMSADTINKLSDAFHKAMVKALKDEYPFVSEPGPGVLRARFAITDVKSAIPVLASITSVIPAGLALSIVKKGVTGTHMNIGGASMEAEFLDAQTRDRVAVVIDERSGAKYKVQKGMTKWGYTEDVFNTWAKRLRKFLDEAHGK